MAKFSNYWNPCSAMSRSFREEQELPQICFICRELKVPELGEFRRDLFRYSKRVWVCTHCLEKAPKRLGRFHERETPVEAVVRQMLEFSGFKFFAEFPIDKYFFDFAIPKLRMLIEVDGAGYHRRNYQKNRDRRKNKIAKDEQWHLIRIRPSSRMGNEVLSKVHERAMELGACA